MIKFTQRRTFTSRGSLQEHFFSTLTKPLILSMLKLSFRLSSMCLLTSSDHFASHICQDKNANFFFYSLETPSRTHSPFYSLPIPIPALSFFFFLFLRLFPLSNAAKLISASLSSSSCDFICFLSSTVISASIALMAIPAM